MLDGRRLAAVSRFGSATVAAITTAGVVLPIINVTHADPALMGTGYRRGRVIASHVNDPGFWLFKGYFFNLSVGKRCVLDGNGDADFHYGAAGVLALNAILH